MIPIARTGLLRKEKEAIKFIQNANELALKMSDKGFHLAFSGGKDSQVIYHLMEASGCKFHAEMQVTTVDPSHLMRFVRKQYPDVRLNRPAMGMKKLIIQKGFLPLRQIRYCCQYLKEHAGYGACTVVGVRAAESTNRAKRKPIELFEAKKPKYKKEYLIEGDKLIKVNKQFDLFEVKNEQVLTCVKGSDKIILSPIFNWKDKDVWDYLRGNNIPYCELYDMGFHRIGCIFCPMSGPKQKARELKLYNGIADKIYIPAIREIMQNGRYAEFETPEEVFRWWLSLKDTKQCLSEKTQYQLPFNGYEQ